MSTAGDAGLQLDGLSGQSITARMAGAGAMRRELEAVLASVRRDAAAADYQRAIMEDNAARKASQNARMWAWKRLKLRYALDQPSSAEFVAFRRAMDDHGPASRGVVCALMLARTDRLFRETTLAILSPLLPSPGTHVDPQAVTDDVDARMLDAGLSWSEESRKSVTNHVLGSWRELGLTQGARERRTVEVRMSHAALRFAIELARLSGLSDRQALTSIWFQLMGLDDVDVQGLLYDAARAGALEYRSQADVVEIGMP